MARKRETHKPKNKQLPGTYYLTQQSYFLSYVNSRYIDTLCNNSYDLTTMIIWGKLRK